MAYTKGIAVDDNNLWRFNYPANGYIFDLRKRRFALYEEGDFTDEELARKLTVDLLFFPKHIEKLEWKAEKEITSLL